MGGMLGKADPYVEMTLGKQKVKSSTVKNNYNPEWNFSANFEVDEKTPEAINIAVFDDDIGKDDSLGSKTIDISSIQEHKQLLNQWIPLENCKSGEILLSAEFVPRGLVQKAKDIGSTLQPESIKKDMKLIETSVKETVEVKIQDSTITEKIVEESETAKEPEAEITSESKEKMQLIVEDSKLTGSISKSTKKLEVGQIYITIIKARDIEKKGNFGKADPYVKMTLGKQKAKSATVKNNHNPEWNFVASFDVDENTSEGVNIAVFDDDFGKDDSLGSKTLDIHSIQEHKQMLNQWIPLENCKSGEVLFSAEFVPQGSVQKSKDIESAVKEDSTKEDLKHIEPTVKETVEVKVEDSTIERQTEIRKQEIHLEEQKEEVLIKKEGQIKIVKEKGAKGLKDLLNKDNKVSSEISVSSDDSTEVVTQNPQAIEPGQIKISVHKARDIEKRGMFGKADPYVIMTHKDQKAKSKTIKNNYNPEWDFSAKFDIKKEVTEGITISVFDDDIGKDDNLGVKTLDINAIIKSQHIKNQWIPLEKSLDSTPVKEATKESKADPKNTEDAKRKD